MRVRLLYFGVLRERLGRADDAVELADGATVGDLLRILRAATSNPSTAGAGALAGGVGAPAEDDRLWKSLAVAVNREYSSPRAALHDGDEVALLPPVSGGCCAPGGCCEHGERLASLADAIGGADGECHAD